MELTIKQALHQGISAQKKGDFRKAEFFYKAILESNPKHSDANHNLGILAASVGKFNTASPYLYTALKNRQSYD